MKIWKLRLMAAGFLLVFVAVIYAVVRLFHHFIPSMPLWAAIFVSLVLCLTPLWIVLGIIYYEKVKRGREKRSQKPVVRWDQDIYHADPEVNRLIIELLRIGRTGGYLGQPGGEYDEEGRHKHARNIGASLFQKGGHGLMVRAAEAVFRVGYPEGPLSSCWHGVGHWQA